MTKEPCWDHGHLLGKDSLPIVTIIDTPGFGNNMKEEQETIDKMVTTVLIRIPDYRKLLTFENRTGANPVIASIN